MGQEKVKDIIVLDTNILYYDKKDFSKIFNSNIFEIISFLKKNELIELFELCIPKVVLNEGINQRLTHIKNKISKITEDKGLLKEFIKINLSNKEDIKKILEKKAKDFIEKNKILVFEYPLIEESKIIDEACSKKPPFFRNGKQEYKDRIIWETIKENAKKDGNNYLFLTNNKTDFNQEILKKEFSAISSKDFEIFQDVAALKMHLDEKFNLKLNLERLYGKKEEEIKNELNQILYNLSGEKGIFSWKGKDLLIASILVEKFNINNISENLIYADIEIHGKAKFFEKEKNQDQIKNGIVSFTNSYRDLTPSWDHHQTTLPMHHYYFSLQKNYEEKEVTIKIKLSLSDYSIVDFSITEGTYLSY